jgi:hypothetical protein
MTVQRASFAALTLVAFCGSGLTPAAAADTEFKYGGYVKMDVLSTFYNHGDVSSESPLRDFHLPSQIPVGDSDDNHDLDFHVKESRFNLGTKTLVEDREINGFLEMDFLLSGQGDEKVSNSFNPRMRHFYAQTGNWLVGQTWTTFMILVIPDDLDFTGAAEGIVFTRQPQIRYTHKQWQFSLENPETIVTPNSGGPGQVTESGRLPDAVVRYDFPVKWGSLGLAGIARQLHIETGSTDDSQLGIGASIGGKAYVGEKDDFRFQATLGQGIGRYVGLNFTNDAVVDADDKLETIGQFAAFASYRHFWNETLRSSANVSFFLGDNNTSFTGDSVNKNAQSYSVNLLYSPVSLITAGVELMHACRELESGVDGTFQRLQLSARYDFGWTPGG